MTTALLVVAGVLVLGAFVAGFVLGRKSAAPVATGAPTDASAAVQIQVAPAEDKAAEAAVEQAKAAAAKAMQLTDAQVAARIAELRARGKAGE